MVLVDSTVIIDHLKGVRTPQTEALAKITEAGTIWCISIYTYLEVLRGARTDQEFESTSQKLGNLNMLYLPEGKATYRKAARMFYDMRRIGKTVRSAIDLLIAQTAIEYECSLLHNDRDFAAIAEYIPDLQIYPA